MHIQILNMHLNLSNIQESSIAKNVLKQLRKKNIFQEIYLYDEIEFLGSLA